MKPLLIAAFLVLGRFAMADELPVPPVPPDDRPVAQAAPVPDVDARPPVPPASEEPRFDVRLYRARSYDPSVGFARARATRTARSASRSRPPG